jgi:hypothetical protein
VNPLWVPLLALGAALGSSTQKALRAVQGKPLRKTIFDHCDEVFSPVLKKICSFLAVHPQARVEDLIIHLADSMRADPQDIGFTAMVSLLYSVAKATPNRTIWSLDGEAYEALTNTTLPWELVRNRLPRLPYEGLLVKLPPGQSLPIQILHPTPFKVDVTSILVVEEIPGRKWRYIGIADNDDFRKVAYSRGWFDLGVASAKAQLTKGKAPPREITEGKYTTITSPYADDVLRYELTGEDKVWQLLINLFLALEHKHLDAHRVRPQVPRGRKKRHFTKHYSPSEYTVVRLSQASREAQKKRATTEGIGRKSMKRHLVGGHWRGVWVIDPENRPVFATKPRVGKDGKSIDGHLYKTAVWIFPFWKGENGKDNNTKKYRVKL